jgi:hypothetical protein
VAPAAVIGAGRRALEARRADQVDDRITAAKLGQALAAAAAGGHRPRRARDHDLVDAPAAGRDHRADRGRLRALALREGGVLDVGAGEAAPVLRPDRRADVQARVRRIGVCRGGPRHAQQLRIGLRHQRVGVGARPQVGVADVEHLAQAVDLRALLGEVRVRRRDRLQLEELPEPLDVVEVDAHVLPLQQPPPLGDDDAHAARRGEPGDGGGRIGDLDQVVARQAHLGAVRALVGDQVAQRPVRPRLLAQLEPPVGDAEVGVALQQRALVGGAGGQGHGQGGRGVAVDRLELDVAAGLR